jgi:hypothetical protein
MSISKKLDETLSKLDLDSSAKELKERVISKSMNNLKEKLSGLDIRVERQKNEVIAEAPKPHYEGTELAEVARKVYRENIKPVVTSDKVAVRDQPSTIASRANVRALSRSLAGMRSSGNEGKTSPVGPNGVGNVGKPSPTGDNGVGNVSGPVGSYYALTTDMTLEEYEAHVQSIFEGEDCDCKHDKEEKTKKEIKARGGPPGYPDTSKKTTKEDVVHELEQRLVTLGSTDWIVVDQVLREMARELDVAPITLSREFRSIHGMYPDKWIKEHLDLEVCGYMPLEEAVRLNKVGKVYEVTFMFRGGTNRLKFFWPHPGDASKEQMQYEVEKFWPKGRVLAFYPTIDNDQNSNYMVMAPPMTENYHFMQPEDWNEVSEETSEIMKMIYEEEGEPVSPVYAEEEGYFVIIEDHETGEERQVMFTEGGLHAWFSKSKSKDGKGGWVQSDGSTCARKPGQTSAPKCYSSQRLAALKRSPEGKKKIRSADSRKKSQDSGQSSKSGAAKPTMVKTFTDPKDKKKYRSGDQTLKDESYDPTIDEACWAGYTQKGTKTMFGKQYPNCVKKGKTKKEEVEYVDENVGIGGNRRANNAPVSQRVGSAEAQRIRDDAKPKPEPEKPDQKANKEWQNDYQPVNKDGKKEGGPGRGPGLSDEAANKIRARLGKGPITKKEEAEMLDGLKTISEDVCPVCGFDPCQCLEGSVDLVTEGGIKSGHKRPTDQGAGLTQKGVDAENAKTGGNLQTAVTTPPSKLKAGSKAAGRRKSFCARSKSWNGERGKAARSRWNC